MHRIASTSLLLGALLVAGACSSSDTASGTSTTASSSTTTTAPATTKAEFLDAGNALCSAMNDESAALTQEYGPQGPDDPAEMAEIIRANSDLIDGVIADLRALPQPAGDEAQLEAMYADGEALADLGRDYADAIESGDRTAVTSIQQEADAAQAAGNADLKAYGLDECGAGS